MAKQTNDFPLMIVVAVALLDACGNVLVQQRPAGTALPGMWEFPGGKLEAGEQPEAGLVRELREELAIAVDLAALTPLTFASVPLADRHLLLLLYSCSAWSGVPQPLAATALAWHRPAALRDLEMPPADVPFIAVLEAAVASTC